ncbi:MAG: tryptophan synthase subunit alpha [Candidatus Omnitrophota bacterium]|nr:tryptophan synthase subunit alpha [Candidatus Omnitrophota bacterium]
MTESRLIDKLGNLRKQKSKVFCAFLTLGYPNLGATEKLIKAFDREGVDIIELGFPFSDPLADGPTIQYSSEKALARGVTLRDAFGLAKKLRRQGCRIPILFFSYLNPIYRYGIRAFAKKAAASGFDGVIVPDLPPEEETGFQHDCRRYGLAQVFLVTPTTAQPRARAIARKCRGFIYYVSLRGVTGARRNISADVRRHLAVLEKDTDKPVLVGFGVSSPKQAKFLSGLSEGVIVGSAIIDRLRKSSGKTGPAIAYIRSMVRAVKS